VKQLNMLQLTHESSPRHQEAEEGKMGSKLLRSKDVAKAVGVSPATVIRWVHQGKLRPAQIIKGPQGWLLFLFEKSAIPEAEAARRSSHAGRPKPKK
jgi:predicted DNA-binding transcriptional regulator AlpA